MSVRKVPILQFLEQFVVERGGESRVSHPSLGRFGANRGSEALKDAFFRRLQKLWVQLRPGKSRFELQGLPLSGLGESLSLSSAFRLRFLLQETTQAMQVAGQYRDRHGAFEAVFASQPHPVQPFALEGIDGGFNARQGYVTQQ